MAIFTGLRVVENLVDRGVKKSKITANTWDDALFDGLNYGVKLVKNIFKIKK